MKYAAAVLGVSLGGMNALKQLIPSLPLHFSMPIVIVQHIGAHSSGNWITVLNDQSKLIVKEADEKEKIRKGSVYIAPPNYHLMIERNRTFSLSIDEKVNFARPSIDVLFETAADAYKESLIGIVLTGANADGAKGLKEIKKKGGMTIVQDPLTAEAYSMPAAAISASKVDHILPLEKIKDLLIKIDESA